MPLRPATLLIAPYFDTQLPSGGVLYTVDLAREWLKRGRQLHVVCIDRPRCLGDLAACTETGQLVIHPLAGEERARFTHHLDDDLYQDAGEVIRQVRPEIIHLHNIQGMLSAALAAIDAGLPTVLTALDFGLVCFNFCLYPGTPHVCECPMNATACAACIRRTIRGPARWLGPVLPRGLTRRIWPRFVRLDQIKSIGELHAGMQRVLRSLSAIVAPSPGLADTLRRFGGADGNVVHVLYGISPEKIVRPAKRVSESLRFAYVGGTDPIKGCQTIVRAVELLPDRLPLEITAIGREDLRSFIDGQSPRVRRYVRWHPPLFGRTMMEQHAHIDAMLVPSIVHENSPFAALESFANGTPVLGSNHPGIRHLIVPDRNGWLIQPGNPAAWARAMIEAVLKPARIRSMQMTAHFTRTITNYANDMEEVEAPLLGKQTRSAESLVPHFAK